jgi:hypothetical protein
MLVTKPRRYSLIVNRDFRRSFTGSIYHGAPDQVTKDHPYSNQTIVWTDSRETHDSPDWRSRIKRGLNATGNLVGNKEGFDSRDGSYSSLNIINPNSAFEFRDYQIFRGPIVYAGNPTSLGLSITRADNQALQRFVSSARSAQTTLQGLATAGELGSTLRQITHTSESVYRELWEFVNGLRRGRLPTHWRRKSSAQLRWIRDRWLEFSLGVKPLVADIDDAMNLLATERKFLSDCVEVHGFGEDVNVSFSPNSQETYNVSWEDMRTDRWQVRYYGKVFRQVPFASPGRDLGPSGFDPSNWLPSLWEIIPYSFVADYFLNIQHVISAYSFNRTLIQWVSRTKRHILSTETVNAHQIHSKEELGLAAATVVPGFMNHWQVTVDRRALDTIGIPTLEFTIPGTSTKWLNLAALFAAGRKTQRLFSN